MKVLKLVAAMALLSNSAMALDTVMGLKGRFDYVRTETENTPGTKDSSGVLTTSFLRLVTDAKLNDTTKAKLTLDFQEGQGSGDQDNGLAGFVDEAFLTKTMGNLSVIVGKQGVMTGGRENDNSSRDLYTESKFKDTIVDNIMGVSAGYNIAGQNIYLQYLQQTDDNQNDGTTQVHTDKKIVGVAYYGSIMDDMIQPIVSYHRQGTSRSGQYDVFTGIGARFNVANFMIEADYLMLTQEKLNGTDDAELNTMVAHVRYQHETFQPFAKFIMEEGKKGFDGIVTGSTESERTAWELGLEYVPNKDEDMRYHVVYSNSESEKTLPVPTSKVEEQKIFAGIAFNYNILK